ncbi:hypothetical protein Hanom_Chr14g01321501 [Helianthus anomalus]
MSCPFYHVYFVEYYFLLLFDFCINLVHKLTKPMSQYVQHKNILLISFLSADRPTKNQLI